jgi:hypothetical protein
MKSYKLETTFGKIAFTAIVPVDEEKAIGLAAKQDLYHRINGKVEKAMGSREVVYDKATADKLIAAYKAQGVEISDVAAYVPAEKEVSRVKATKLYEQAALANKLPQLAKNCGYDVKLAKPEAIEAVHAFLSGGLLAKLTS